MDWDSLKKSFKNTIKNASISTEKIPKGIAVMWSRYKLEESLPKKEQNKKSIKI